MILHHLFWKRTFLGKWHFFKAGWLSCHPTNSINFKPPKETQCTDPNEWPGLCLPQNTLERGVAPLMTALCSPMPAIQHHYYGDHYNVLFTNTVTLETVNRSFWHGLTRSSAFGIPVGVTPFEYRPELWNQKTRVPGLMCGVIAWSCLAVLTQYRHVTDTQTHDNSIYHASIASHRQSQNYVLTAQFILPAVDLFSHCIREPGYGLQCTAQCTLLTISRPCHQLPSWLTPLLQ